MKQIGVYIGRFNPLHNGHMNIIDKMLDEHGLDNSIIFIGSCNAPRSARNFFTYGERMSLLYMALGYNRSTRVSIIGIPDFPESDYDWITNINNILKLKASSLSTAKFYVGRHQDAIFEDQYPWIDVEYFDRKDEDVSATEIRRRLFTGESFEHMVPATVHATIKDIFREKYLELERFKP